MFDDLPRNGAVVPMFRMLCNRWPLEHLTMQESSS